MFQKGRVKGALRDLACCTGTPSGYSGDLRMKFREADKPQLNLPDLEVKMQLWPLLRPLAREF